MPTCSPAREARVKPPRRACLQRRCFARRVRRPSPTAPAKIAWTSPTACTPTCTSSTRQAVPASTTFVRKSSGAFSSLPRAAATRSTSSTRFICFPRRRSTRCSKLWKSLPTTWCSSCAPPTRKRSPKPFIPDASASTSIAYPTRRSSHVWARFAVRKGSTSSPRHWSSSRIAPRAGCATRSPLLSSLFPSATTRSPSRRPSACWVRWIPLRSPR